MAVFASKKREVRFITTVVSLFKTTIRFSAYRIVLGAKGISAAPNGVLSAKCIVLF